MFDFFDDSCGCRGVDLGNKAAKGQDYSETQRYEAALDVDQQAALAGAWHNLGGFSGGTVLGKNRSPAASFSDL